MELHLALGRVRQKPSLVLSFREGAGLELEKLYGIRRSSGDVAIRELIPILESKARHRLLSESRLDSTRLCPDAGACRPLRIGGRNS